MTHAPRHIKDGLLECYLVDALAPDVRARLEAQLATSPADQARLEELRADSAAFLTSYPEGPLVARYEAEHQNSSNWWRWVRMILRMDGSSIRRENPTEVVAPHPTSERQAVLPVGKPSERAAPTPPRVRPRARRGSPMFRWA
jgi:anti-sigma factor RsiW